MTDIDPRPDSDSASDPASDPELDAAGRPRRGRKERVLHTRISQQLAADIGRMADDLRVPVSNLVRNVLEEVFSVVETVTENVGELIEDVMDEAGRARERARHGRFDPLERRRERERAAASRPDERTHTGAEPPRPEPPDVLGWQPLILARAGACSDCAAALPRGGRAYVGITASGPGAHMLCADCLDARRQP